MSEGRNLQGGRDDASDLLELPINSSRLPFSLMKPATGVGYSHFSDEPLIWVSMRATTGTPPKSR
jgi:hypothetical protein